jgi:hypothetical protein
MTQSGLQLSEAGSRSDVGCYCSCCGSVMYCNLGCMTSGFYSVATRGGYTFV